MQSLEAASIAQDYGEPLLYIICALGARYAILGYYCVLSSKLEGNRSLTHLYGL